MSIPIPTQDADARWMSMDDGSFLWAVRLTDVVAVRALDTLDVLPQVIPGMLGLMSHLGQLVPVVDVAQLLGRPATGSGQVVVVVRQGDWVLGIRCQGAGQMLSGQPVPPPSTPRPGWGPERVPGMYCLRSDSGVWWIADTHLLKRRLGGGLVVNPLGSTRVLRLEAADSHLAVDLSLVVRVQLLDQVLLEKFPTALGGIITGRYREEGGWWPVWSVAQVLGREEGTGGVLVTLAWEGRPLLLRVDRALGLLTPQQEDCLVVPPAWWGRSDPLCDHLIRATPNLWRISPAFFAKRGLWSQWDTLGTGDHYPSQGR